MCCENYHMLDTNIVLSMVLSNNTKRIANEYLKKDFIRYISDTVCIESQNKILDIKRISLCISEFVKNFSLNNSIDYLNTSYFLNNAKKNFLNQYDYGLPISVPKIRFENMVDDIFLNFELELRNILINNDNESLNLIIRNSFRKIM